MKITAIDIPKEYEDNGLHDVRMKNLAQIVLLAGKNGSGKSRLLQKIQNIANERLIIEDITIAKAQIKENEKYIDSLMGEIASHGTNPARKDQCKTAVINLKDQIIKTEQSLERTNYLNLNVESKKCSIVNFVPKELKLEDPLTMAKRLQENKAKEVAINLGCSSLADRTLAVLQNVQDRYFNATHQHFKVAEKDLEDCSEEYKKLQTILELFIGEKLERNIEGNATLFGFPIGNAKLSDGQKVLLQLCVAIHCQETALSEVIIFMDEPENHLHPSAIIEAIDNLKERLPDGQIWIATHSINILSHFFDSNNLWYVDEGKVNFEGKAPEKVLRGLLGDDEEMAKMRGFIDYPAQLAITLFACECLCPPSSIMTSAEDPQTVQVKKAIQALYAENQSVKILDWGAGKGRLLANLSEDNKDEIRQRVDYVAWDFFPTDSNLCKSIIAGIYGTSDNRYFNDFTALRSTHNEKSFHLIVLCNVLHEIPPDGWIHCFNAISDLLIDSGALLIVENQCMPSGEKAHKNGFIVLDTPSLKRLFNITGPSNNDFVFNDARGNGKLKAHLIRKTLLGSVSGTTLKNALELHKDQCIEKIKELRGIANPDYKTGQLHAFWCQQFTNTHLVLETI